MTGQRFAEKHAGMRCMVPESRVKNVKGQLKIVNAERAACVIGYCQCSCNAIVVQFESKAACIKNLYYHEPFFIIKPETRGHLGLFSRDKIDVFVPPHDFKDNLAKLGGMLLNKPNTKADFLKTAKEYDALLAQIEKYMPAKDVKKRVREIRDLYKELPE